MEKKVVGQKGEYTSIAMTGAQCLIGRLAKVKLVCDM